MAFACMAWHGRAWQGMAGQGMAWHGRAWQGMAWHGRAGHGMAWHGMACVCAVCMDGAWAVACDMPCTACTFTTTRSPVDLSVARCTWPIEAHPTGAQVKELNTSPIGLPSSASMTSRTDASGRGGMSFKKGWKRSEYTLGTTPPVLDAIFWPVL